MMTLIFEQLLASSMDFSISDTYGLKFGTRLFIQDIKEGSLAEKHPELKTGDTIMMVNFLFGIKQKATCIAHLMCCLDFVFLQHYPISHLTDFFYFNIQINGRNVDNKTVDEAIQIIGLSKDKLTMVVKSEDGGTVTIPASQFSQPTASPKKSKHKDKHAGRGLSDKFGG